MTVDLELTLESEETARTAVAHIGDNCSDGSVEVDRDSLHIAAGYPRKATHNCFEQYQQVIKKVVLYIPSKEAQRQKMQMLLFVAVVMCALASVLSATNLRYGAADASTCRTDVGSATKSVAAASAAIARSVKTCANGFSQRCNEDIAFALNQLTAASADITAAVYHCGGSEPTACSADINAALADLTSATTDIMNAVLDCQSTSDIEKCRSDTNAAATSIADCGFDIAKAVNDC